MKNDTITLILKGNIPLLEFADAIKYLHVLVEALSEEVAGDVDIKWHVSKLDTGSAIAGVTGCAAEMKHVERVVCAYGVVGQSLADRTLIPYSERVSTPAIEMTRIINGNITSIQFVCNDSTFSITQSLANDFSLQISKEETDICYSFGAITGTVDTLSRRSGITFTLYDEIFDRAVTCYMTQEQQEKVRDIWGKRVRVIGFIHRDPGTGKAQKVKNIQKIDILSPELERGGGYLCARGAVPWEPGDEPSETVIRRLRDVG